MSVLRYVGLLAALAIAGMWFGGVRLSDFRSLGDRGYVAPVESYPPVPPSDPKDAIQQWLLQQWLPTVLAAPYGATVACAAGKTASAWRCTVTQTAAAEPLPLAERRRWRLRAVGVYPSYTVAVLS